MKNTNETASQMANFLLQIKAIKLNNEHPFTWASGRKSPIYCDNRITLSYPEIRTFIRQRFVDVVNENWGNVDVIAGVATGGIAQGALVAQELGKPFVYVRSEAKSHGLTNQIEGEIHEGQSVVVIEDLVSTGKSSLIAVHALREKGCIVKGMAAIFTYGLDVAAKNFAEAEVDLRTLTNYDTLIEVASKEEYIRPSDQESLSAWRKNPEAWSDARMGN
ncbi:MAG: orotate phosphoribosyltransferase [Bacteroidales bacterium]|nr:orotate phosphoribosyltransferase [Bacteroidales bacterium]MBP5644869.1 orotate phosphoribosyltransferase [Bacteroidales bacterium]